MTQEFAKVTQEFQVGFFFFFALPLPASLLYPIRICIEIASGLFGKVAANTEKEGKNQGTIFREEEENYSLKLLASFSQGVRNIRCSLSYSTDWTLSAMVNVTLCSRSCFTVPWNQFRITFLFLCECSLLLLPFYCKNSLLEDGKWGTIICRPVSLGQDYSWIAMLFSLTKPICCWNSMLSVGWYNVVHFGTLKLDSDILIPIAAYTGELHISDFFS